MTARISSKFRFVLIGTWLHSNSAARLPLTVRLLGDWAPGPSRPERTEGYWLWRRGWQKSWLAGIPEYFASGATSYYWRSDEEKWKNGLLPNVYKTGKYGKVTKSHMTLQLKFNIFQTHDTGQTLDTWCVTRLTHAYTNSFCTFFLI